MKKILLLIVIMESTYARELDPFDTSIVIKKETTNNNSLLLMKGKQGAKKVPIDRSAGFFGDTDNAALELADEVMDISAEEKAVNTLVKTIVESIKDDFTSSKLEKVKTELPLENVALEDVEVRYQRLLKIDSIPREPSDSEEFEVNEY